MVIMKADQERKASKMKAHHEEVKVMMEAWLEKMKGYREVMQACLGKTKTTES
jgi:hypothetical protein